MIHLFNKIYLDTDEAINQKYKKVFVSDVSVKYIIEDINNNNKSIITSFSNINQIIEKHKSLNDFFVFISQFNEKIIIYADEKNYLTFLIFWISSILKNPNKKEIFLLVKSLLFRENIFNNSRFNFNNKKNNKNYQTLNEICFNKIFDELKFEDLAQFKKNTSVEYLLTSFLFDGSFKEELKFSMTNLIRKDLIKYLYELKEIFLVHLRTTKFIDKLQLKNKYDFSNFDEILYDDSKFSNLFTTERIWNKPFKIVDDDKDSIMLKNITEEDIVNFKEFTVISGSSWVEESCYIFMKSDVNKLDFLPCFSNFTDDLLYKIIEAESTFDHSAGSFFSIDLSTVNHYFIQTILENKNNKEFLKSYIL